MGATLQRAHVGGWRGSVFGNAAAPLASTANVNYYAVHDVLLPTVHTGAPAGD